jgi:hypothetical protein
MQSVNRTAVVIRPKQPFVDWLNSVPGESSDNTLERISSENTTFLIPEFFGHNESLVYIKKIYDQIFEFELFGWYTDEDLWPEKRTWKMFQEWFDIEMNSEVFDLVDEYIEKEEM